MSIANTILDEQANEPLKDKLDRWLDVLNDCLECVEECAERYPSMQSTLKKYEQTIDEMYNLLKGL